MVRLTDDVQVSPEYNEMTADVSGKYKVSPKYLRVTLGYSYEQRRFDELNAKRDTQDFAVNGGKLVFDIPLKPIKVKLGYDVAPRFPSRRGSPPWPTLATPTRCSTGRPTRRASSGSRA